MGHWMEFDDEIRRTIEELRALARHHNRRARRLAVVTVVFGCLLGPFALWLALWWPGLWIPVRVLDLLAAVSQAASVALILSRWRAGTYDLLPDD